MQLSAGKVNAIAGANRQRNQQTVAESESSTSTSDESTDDEMDTEPAPRVVMESEVPDDVDDTVKTEDASVTMSALSQQQDLVESSAAEVTEAVTMKQPAFHIAVNRTTKIQVFSSCVFIFYINVLRGKLPVDFI